MKVRIGDTTYDSDEEPIAVILTPRDRLDIIAMPPNLEIYVKFPKGIDLKLIQQWLVDVPAFAMDNQSGGEG